MKTQIKAEIVADSVNQQGDRLTSVLVTMPRIILSEMNTHRMLSKNTSSSRAIPFKKMVEAVQNDPFIPVAWQKQHSGMQGNEYFTDKVDLAALEQNWLLARDRAVQTSVWLNEGKLTKQLCNRLLEPFMWTTMLITGSKESWDNFFNLRNPQYYFEPEDTHFKSKKEWVKVWNDNFDDNIDWDVSRDYIFWAKLNKGQAEIHLMDLSEKIYDEYQNSVPKKLEKGEWHIPFGDKIGRFVDIPLNADITDFEIENNVLINKVKISTAMAARTSYTVVGDEKEINYQKMIDLHDRLIAQNPPHSSPMEHCAKAMSDDEYQFYIKGKLIELNPDRDFNENIEIEEPLHEEKGWARNFKGFIQYRHIIETK